MLSCCCLETSSLHPLKIMDLNKNAWSVFRNVVFTTCSSFQGLHADGQRPGLRHPCRQPPHHAQDPVQAGAVGELGSHPSPSRVQLLLQAGRTHLQHQRRKSKRLKFYCSRPRFCVYQGYFWPDVDSLLFSDELSTQVLA